MSRGVWASSLYVLKCFPNRLDREKPTPRVPDGGQQQAFLIFTNCSAFSIMGAIIPPAPASSACLHSFGTDSAIRARGNVPPNSRARKRSGSWFTLTEPCSMSPRQPSHSLPFPVFQKWCHVVSAAMCRWITDCFEIFHEWSLFFRVSWLA